MITHLENDMLIVAISAKGAELQSILNKSNQLEYLWQGDAKHWARRSPVLFPIVGALKDGSYIHNGKSYAMGQHGFARDKEFQVIATTNNSVSYELQHSDETLQSYPFEFTLLISYRLQGNVLKVTYEVENAGDRDLYYSIGAHPAFNCPMLKGETRRDYRLVFSQKETLSRQLIEKGIRTGEGQEVLVNQNSIALTETIFERDALIFEKPVSSEITLMKGDKPYLKMNFKEFDYLGVWSKSSISPFVCLEPWMGIADHQVHNKKLCEKEGIRRLQKGNGESFAYTLEMYV